ncbi:type I secretion system permease/ATPase [Eubacteriales bacterium OttesenSCG-928-K08]|nr:type I secretion system permease/ATPase [Eubacteriales bacterium OttesenSCG-928-K08]
MNKEPYNQKPEEDSGLVCLLMVASFLGTNTTAEQLRHSLALETDDFGVVEILSAAKHLKLKAATTETEFKKLALLTSPAIARCKDGSFLIVAKGDETRILVIRPPHNKPEILAREEFEEIWDYTLIRIAKKGLRNQIYRFGFKWFIPTIIKYKKQFIAVFIAALVVQILGIASPIITQVVVDKVLVHKSLSTLNMLMVGLFIVYVYEYVMGITKNYIFTNTTNKIDVILSSRLFKHLFSLPLRYFEARRIGETVARVRELDHIRSFLTGAPLTVLLDVLFVSIYIVILFLYDASLTWIVIASMIAYAILSGIITPLLKSRLDEKFNTGAEAQSFLVESVTGINTIKSFALEPEMESRWGDLQANYVKAGYKTTMLATNANTTASFIQKAFDLLILFLGAKLVIDGKLTVGQMVAFRMLSGRVSGPVLHFVQLWQDFQQASLSVQRIGDIFNTAPEMSSEENTTRLPAIQGHIEFDKVRFRYRPDLPEAIRDMSFTIEPGTTIGVVGRSGSGKSTLAKLIQRMYVAEGGKILIDGSDIALINPDWLRQQIGVVLQENFMFNLPVKENISIHHKSASIEQIIHAAKMAGAHDFILELENGYDTMIGERGVNLSGGQKQRIAIARALLANPRILIFDEATSALDYESESIIQKNLKQICNGRTVIFIAHRLSTIMGSDQIMVVDRGSIVEFGSPEELLKQQGLFHYLYDQQKRGE